MQDDPLVLLPDEQARQMMIAAMQNIATWPIKSPEQFRNAVLGGAFAITPLLEIDDMDTVAHVKSLLTETVRSGQMIDFGFVPNTMIQWESQRSRHLFEAGEFIDPFETWLGIMPWEGGCNGYLISRSSIRGSSGVLVFELYGVSIPDVGDLILLYDMISIEVGGIHDTRCKPFPMKVIDGQTPPGSERAANSLDPLVTMLRLLHDASIPIRPVPAPERLNKARRKAGKAPIPAHTVVDTKDYVSAFQGAPSRHGEWKGGHHAPPISHWRRAHTRRLPSGKIVAVREAKINFREAEEIHRLFYRV